jgi:hypothetical protein
VELGVGVRSVRDFTGDLSWPVGMIAGMARVLAIADQRRFQERSPVVSR